jgi:hypothetical protein
LGSYEARLQESEPSRLKTGEHLKTDVIIHTDSFALKYI